MATTIAVRHQTKNLLSSLGNKGDTYDKIISRMALAYEEFIEEQYKRLGEKHKFKKLVL